MPEGTIVSASRLRFARVKPVALLGGAVAALLLVTACGSSSTASETTAQAAASGSAAGSAAPAGTAADTLRLGYFPNVTHAAAVLGVANGTFQSALGDTKLETSTFNAGPAAIEALLSGAIDATFIGPNPAINSFVKSNGDSIRIVAGPPCHQSTRDRFFFRRGQLEHGRRAVTADGQQSGGRRHDRVTVGHQSPTLQIGLERGGTRCRDHGCAVRRSARDRQGSMLCITPSRNTRPWSSAAPRWARKRKNSRNASTVCARRSQA